MDPDLMLGKAKKQIRQCQMIYEQQKELKWDKSSSTDAIQWSSQHNHKWQQYSGGWNAHQKKTKIKPTFNHKEYKHCLCR